MQHTNIIDWSEDFDGAGRELRSFDFARDDEIKRCYNDDNVKIYCVSEDENNETPVWVIVLIVAGVIIVLVILWIIFKATACCKRKWKCSRIYKKEGAYG